MTQKQHYMTEKERYQLEAYLRAKKPVAWIARELGFCRQTIYNELKRGSYIHTCKWWEEVRYSADKGQQAALQKRRNKGRPVKVPRDSEHWRFLEARLIGEQTDGRIKKKTRCSPAVAIELARRAGFPVICVNTLYSYIYQGRMGRAKACNLWEAPYRRKNEGRNSRVVHPQLPSIEIRPEHINQRQETGHKEMDLVISSRAGRAALLAMTDRKSRQEILRKIPSKEAENVVRVLRSLKRQHIKIASITTDNGSEFLRHDDMKKLIPEIYYCHSYAAWEKGTVENHNRMIRRWFPKGTNFDKIKPGEIAELEEWMNNYPRKSLGWRTPNEIAAGM